jgi:hypothetical protein
MSSIINQSPYLRTSRSFPEEDAKQLSVELNRSYVDIAQKMNSRTISLFPTNRPAITGESWFLTGNQKQQGLRQVYTFTSLPATIPHGITIANIYGFVRIFGAFTDGTYWYPLPYVVNSGSANGQTQVYLDNTNIYIASGTTGPSATQGQVVLEWLSDV